jgi:hypothetical protein
MARLARPVIPGLPHHIAQRGNRRQRTIFDDGAFLRSAISEEELRDLREHGRTGRPLGSSALIARCKETAAMRSRVNTAKLPEGNPTLTRLRELEVLETVATNSKLNVVLGEKGLAERVVNLL